MDKITKRENLLKTFPEPLLGTKKINVLAKIIADELVRLYELGNFAGIYTGIEKLDEPLLDILAEDFRLNWYNSKADLRTKREMLKRCFKIHRQIGTVGACLSAVQSIYPTATINDQYLTFSFNIFIPANGNEPLTNDKYSDLIQQIEFFKNVRSTYKIYFQHNQKTSLYFACALRIEAVKTLSVTEG